MTRNPNEITVNIPLHFFQSLMVSHVNYCVGRHSYLVTQCISALKEHWILLNSTTRDLIYDNIKDHLRESVNAYDEPILKQDFEEWQDALEWIKTHRDTEYRPPRQVVDLPVRNPKQREN